MNENRSLGNGPSCTVVINDHGEGECSACYVRPKFLYSFVGRSYCHRCYICKKHPGRYPLLEAEVLQLRLFDR
jgi:hypothetical protein